MYLLAAPWNAIILPGIYITARVRAISVLGVGEYHVIVN